jgi:dUTP pyrophosphatase
MPIKCIRKDSDAVLPTKAHDSDIGWDLVAIREHKVINEDIIMYDTGIVAIPPKGYYLEILPRSSISKTGWMLANSVGTIDPDYRGNLYIVLTRVVKSMAKIELPFCKCQLVLRKIEKSSLVEVTEEEIDVTERGSGGFGSTGARTS